MNDFSPEIRRPVCFFDSGIGGITLLGECVRRMPDMNFIYFADNANVPYGNLSKDKITLLTDRIFSEIETYNPSAAVIACNTVTALCAPRLRAKYNFPIIGIQPAIKPAAKNSERCVVLATAATAHSTSIIELVERFGNGVTEIIACPDLAAYIERNVFDLNKEEVFALLPDIEADSIVLGCTHYAYIEQAVKEKYRCPVFDGMEGTAKRLCEVLGNRDHFETHLPQKFSNLSENNTVLTDKVTFIGGDADKNERIFREIIMPSEKIWGNFSH